MEQRFAYNRSIAPNLSVLLGLAIAETIVLHILAMALWGWHVAVALGLIDLSAVLFIIRLLGDLKRHPVTIADGVVTIRLGRLKSIAFPAAQVSGLRTQWDAAGLKQPGVANLALATWPNVVIDLAAPLMRRGKPVMTIAHKLDDPAAFALALDACMGRA